MTGSEGGTRINKFPAAGFHADLPVISIITVVYNNRAALEKTWKSVVSQSYPNIEYLVIDGGSKDGTLEWITAHQDQISYWLSEKDSGIYDAMNKGLKAATGDYVWFMNAGDQIPDPGTVESFMKNDPAIDVYYGDAMVIDDQDQFVGMRRLRPPKNLTWHSLGMGMVVCHQSILIRRALAGLYKLQYRIAADYEWVLSALKKSTVIENTGMILTKYLWDGFSRHHVPLSLKERFLIMLKNYGVFLTIYYHFLITLRLVPSFLHKISTKFSGQKK